MREGIQSFFRSVGEFAGMALCVIQVAEEILKTSFDVSEVVRLLENGVRSGFLFYTHGQPDDPRNFNVLNLKGFLSCIVLKEVSVRHVDDPLEIEGFRALDNEYVVQRYLQEDVRGRAFFLFRRPSWDAGVSQGVIRVSKIDRLTVFTVI
jgi:hypothetical protein